MVDEKILALARKLANSSVVAQALLTVSEELQRVQREFDLRVDYADKLRDYMLNNRQLGLEKEALQREISKLRSQISPPSSG